MTSYSNLPPESKDKPAKKSVADQEIERLSEENFELKKLCAKYRQLLSDYGISESEADQISDAEAVCLTQIEFYKRLTSRDVTLSKDEAQTFEIFCKQLRALQSDPSKTKKTPPGKQMSDEDLISLYKQKNELS